MTDRLDGVLATAAPLLKRVDEVLAASGAPPDHQVWSTLRRVRLLPWGAVQAIAALRPDDLTGAAPELRADARSYAGLAESLPPPGAWSGTAADAYDEARKRAAAHLSGSGERLAATADLADALTAWMSEARTNLAAALAEVLTSAEALTLSTHTTQSAIDPAATREADAAADVAARVLEAVADSYEAATDLMHTSADLTDVHWS